MPEQNMPNPNLMPGSEQMMQNQASNPGRDPNAFVPQKEQFPPAQNAVPGQNQQAKTQPIANWEQQLWNQNEQKEDDSK